MWWWWWWWVLALLSGVSYAFNTTQSEWTTTTTTTSTTTTTTTPSNTPTLPTDTPSCRMGYSVKDYYPTEGNYYNHQTCFFCYHFVPSHRRNHSLEVESRGVTLTDGQTREEFVFRVDDLLFPFEPEDEEGWSHVLSSLVDELEGDKLTSCCKDAQECCKNTLITATTTTTTTMTTQQDTTNKCPGTWDGWHCFPSTLPGTVVTFTCPKYAYRGLPECTLEGQKHCLPNGTWTVDSRGTEVTDYSTCSHSKYHHVLYVYEAITHCISLTVLPLAIFILLFYRQLRVQRFYLHLNLFLALFGKALFNAVEIIALRIPEYSTDTSPLDQHSIGCRVLVFLGRCFNMAVWSWMLTESFYLHRLIVAAFRGGGKTWVYVLMGWVPAVVLTVSWAVSKSMLEDSQCWLGDDPSNTIQLHLILDIPKLFILIVNTVLLINMTRVLLTKLQNVNTNHATATRNAVKATIFLLPMFGLQFSLTLYLPPPTTSCSLLQVYFFVAMAIDGLQGLYVSVVYCFINKEVRLQVRRSVYRIKGHLYTVDNSAVNYPHTDFSLVSTSTAPPHQHAEMTPLNS